MNKLEYLLINFLQKCKTDEVVKTIDRSTRYVTLEGELLLITKTLDTDMYITTECNLQNMETELFKCEKIVGDTYKIRWKDLFRYLTGEISENEIDRAYLTNEIKMLRLSPKPLTNFLKTK